MIKIKILVADDNPLTLQSLQTTVPWKEWGYELTACAKNGNEAWEKISRYHPDIVILDIHMPGMNGLEVASLIQNLQERPVVILLSAYDEFTYAKKGIRLGVFDYLLKPLDNGELKMVLDKAAQFLEKESHRNNQTWRKDWCEKLLMEGLSGGLDAAQTLGAYLSEQWHPYGYSLILLQRQDGSKKNFEAFRTEISDILRNEPVQHLIVEVKDGSVILLGFTSLRLVRDYDLEALYFANIIVERAKACALRLFAGISNYTEKPERLENMYEEAKFAAESRFFLENKSVIHYQSVMSRSVHNEYLMSRKMQDIFLALSQKNVDGFLDCLDAFIELLQQDKRYDTEYVRTIFSQIAFSVSSMLDNCSMGNGWIGKPLYVTANMMSSGVETWHPSPQAFYEKGGGPLYDMAGYYLSVLIHFFGPVAEVFSYSGKGFEERRIYSQPLAGETVKVDVPTHYTSVLKMKNGILVNMNMSFDIWHSTLPKMEIYGTEGTLTLPDPNLSDGKAAVFRKEQAIEWTYGIQSEQKSYELPLRDQSVAEYTRGTGMAEMVRAIESGRENRAGVELAIHILEVIHGMMESSESGAVYKMRTTCEQPPLWNWMEEC